MRVAMSRKLSSGYLPAQAQGSYQDLGNRHVFLGYGSIPVMQEFDGSDKLVMDVSFGDRDNDGVKGYRSYKQTWSATPYWAPKVVATIKSGMTDLYMSWNGATDITGWSIYTGDTVAGLKKFKTVNRAGFETHHQFKNKRKFLQIEAVRAGGPVRKSKVIRPTVL